MSRCVEMLGRLLAGTTGDAGTETLHAWARRWPAVCFSATDMRGFSSG